MTDDQWRELLQTIRGTGEPGALPVGLIVDSPWLPGWAGVSILDYFTDERLWLDVNLKAVERFPRVAFLPGFWSEFGMCTEPSAFGVKCVWIENAFPSVEKMLDDYDQISRLRKPNCRSDGLLPFVLKRLEHGRGAIEKAGHRIRFAVARGPLNIASYLLGHTELLVGVKTNPDEVHRLLRVVTDFLLDWLALQIDSFDSIEGILLLDDLIGFLREDDFNRFVVPYFKELYSVRPVAVRFLHNDAHGLITARHLAEIGVNLFNFSHQHPLGEMRRLAGAGVGLLGGVPPRDVLGCGRPEDVRRAVREALEPLDDRRGLMLSAGGGAPPGMTTENIEALAGPWPVEGPLPETLA